MEDPGYSPARQMFMAMGASVVSVPVDEQGIRVDRTRRHTADLRDTLREFPLGMPMSPAP